MTGFETMGKMTYYNATSPTAIALPQGTIVWDTNAAAANPPGWYAVTRIDTTMRQQALAAAVIMEVTSTALMVAGDIIGIVLDNGLIHWTTINAITDADTLFITAQIPAGRTANVGAAVYTNRWKAMGGPRRASSFPTTPDP